MIYNWDLWKILQLLLSLGQPKQCYLSLPALMVPRCVQKEFEKLPVLQQLRKLSALSAASKGGLSLTAPGPGIKRSKPVSKVGLDRKMTVKGHHTVLALCTWFVTDAAEHDSARSTRVTQVAAIALVAAQLCQPSLLFCILLNPKAAVGQLQPSRMRKLPGASKAQELGRKMIHRTDVIFLQVTMFSPFQ